jgi:outer membrane lipoprotein-sorting protein
MKKLNKSKKFSRLKISLGIVLLFIGGLSILSMRLPAGISADDIIAKANEKMRGNTLQAQITVQIIRPTWTRELSMKSWSKGLDMSMALVTAPAQDKGTVYLKRKKEAWNWVPAIQRTIKLPPSMMSQSWMGTDLTNDDLINSSSIVDDYIHKLVGEETIAGRNCYKIELDPKPQAAVVWGKIVTWVDKTEYFQMKSQFFDEDGNVVNTMNFTNIKSMGGRSIPTHFEVIPADKPGNKTVMIYNNLIFDKPIADDFFTVQTMHTVK